MKNIYISLYAVVIVMLLSGCKNWDDQLLQNIHLDKEYFSESELSIIENTSFQKIGGEGYDWAPSIMLGKDYYIIAGATNGSFDESTDFLVIKSDMNRKILRSRVLGGVQQDLIVDADKINDKLFVIYGNSQSMFFTPLPGIYAPRPLIICLNENLDIVWARDLRAFNSEIRSAASIDKDTFFCVGEYYWQEPDKKNNFNTLITKLGIDGTVIWSKILNKNRYNSAVHILNKGDKNFILGDIKLDDKISIFVTQIDKEGVVNTTNVISLNKPSVNGIKIISSNDNGYYILGSINAKTKNMFVIKLKKDFIIEWAREYGTENNDMCYDIIESPDGSIILTGYTEGIGKGKKDGLLLNISKTGYILNIGVFGNRYDDIFTHTRIINGSYVSMGITTSEKDQTSDMIIYKYNDPKLFSPSDQFKNLFFEQDISSNINTFSSTVEDIIFENIKLTSEQLVKRDVKMQ